MPDSRVAERWTVVSTLAVRDAAVTRLCRDDASGRLVVVKTLSLKDAKDRRDLELFEREARVLRGLSVPRVPRFVDSVVEEVGGDVKMHLAQEHVAGASLLAAVRDGRRFDPRDAARIGVQLCETLDALHRATPPLVHRDVKPANVVLDESGAPWLVDFGAAKADAPGAGARGVTVVGTYGYMAPEQYEGRAGPSADVFALGHTLWFLLSHKEPWEHDEAGPRAALAAATHVPEPLRRALLDATNPDVDARTGDGRALGAAQRRFLAGDDAPRRPVPTAVPEATHRAPAALAIGALVVAIGLGAALFGMRAGPQEGPPPSAPGDPIYKVPAPPPAPPAELVFGDHEMRGALRCLQRSVHRIFESRGRYLKWADEKAGPTCKERYVSYGLYTAYDDAIATCAEAAAKAAASPPDDAAFDQAIAALADAHKEVVPLIAEASKYYSDEDYKDDACAKGQALHPRLIAAWERTRDAVDAVSAQIDRRAAEVYGRSRARVGGDPVLARALEVVEAERALAAAAPAWHDAPSSPGPLLQRLDALRAAYEGLLAALAALPEPSRQGHIAQDGLAQIDSHFVEMKKRARALREGEVRRHPSAQYAHYDPTGLRMAAHAAMLYVLNTEVMRTR